jgi:hypothetical protein
MLVPNAKCYVYIVSMTVLINLMHVYSYIYIRNKMSFVYIRKIIFLYCIYCCYSFAWLMHGGYYLPQKGQRMHVYCPLALSPEAEDFFTFTWEFVYFTTYTHSPKVFNKNDELHSKINHRQFSCFNFITCM